MSDRTYWLKVRFGAEGPVGVFVVDAAGAVEAWESLFDRFSKSVRRQARLEEIVPERGEEGDV